VALLDGARAASGLHGGLLLGGAMDAAALGQVVDGELDDLAVRVEAADQVAGGLVGTRVAELPC